MASTMTDPRDCELGKIDLGEVEAVVGERSFERGLAYARKGRVVKLEWDPHTQALTGSVTGHGAVYATTAYFTSVGSGALTFEDGECSCPMGYNCKHVPAIVVAATDLGLRWLEPGQRTLHPVNTSSPLPSWEVPLRALVDSPEAQVSGTPIAIELAMHRGGAGERGGRRLLGRLMRPGARGGWINGSMAWSGLDTWHVKNAGFRPDHLALVSELHAIRQASQRRTSSYSYGSYGAEKTLDLSDYGTQLWSMLDEAARIGLPLIHARNSLGELARHVHGEVQLDVTQPAGADSEVRARLRIDGDGAVGLEPLVFLGPNGDGHGIVCAEPGADDIDSRPLRMVRLARPVAQQLQRMLLDGESLVIPATDLRRFSEELCPALARVATVMSSDGSFTPPEVSPPSLLLRARYSAPHTVDLAWEWVYQIGGTTSHAPLTARGLGGGFRDLDAERTVLAGTSLVETGLERFGLVDDRGRPRDGPVALHGLDSMRFTTDHLPSLAGLAGIAVEIEGEPADYRDVAGSLEIGVSTGEIQGEHDWFDLGVTITVEGRPLPFSDVFVALASSEPDMLLPDGAHFSLHDARLQSLRELIEEARALVDSPSGPLRISRYQAGLWAELAALGVVTHQARAWQSQVKGLLELDAITDHEPPATLLADLRPYQREGFAWLACLWELGLGGILADDMGLGKTLQALALICHARDRDPDVGPFLVIAPTSVVPGWVGEAAQFAPTLRVEAVTDTFAKSGRTIDEIAKADVVVTTYTLLRLEPDVYGAVSWAGVICDEAQNIKNHQAKSYRCVRELATPFKLALSGTPMENNLMELWSLLSITAPGLFPEPKRFAEQYARPIERHSDGERLARLRRRIKPLVKRRTKELVASDLPAKQEQTFEVDLHPRHRKLYDTHLQRERQRVLGLLGDFDRNRFTILRSITLLRQLSLHAGLVDERHHAVPCAKLGALTEQLVDVIGGGHRALVFSQFTSFLTKVRESLDREGVSYCYLDGRTRSRQKVIERFRGGDDPAFLISLKAGGVGLNLVEADYCFLLDPWWNPATENQAIDRTHRIGQTRQVMVYRMIAKDTIEEKVVALARRKALLFKGVMDDGDVFASGITAEDIRGLFA